MDQSLTCSCCGSLFSYRKGTKKKYVKKYCVTSAVSEERFKCTFPDVPYSSDTRCCSKCFSVLTTKKGLVQLNVSNNSDSAASSIGLGLNESAASSLDLNDSSTSSVPADFSDISLDIDSLSIGSNTFVSPLKPAFSSPIKPTPAECVKTRAKRSLVLTPSKTQSPVAKRVDTKETPTKKLGVRHKTGTKGYMRRLLDAGKYRQLVTQIIKTKAGLSALQDVTSGLVKKEFKDAANKKYMQSLRLKGRMNLANLRQFTWGGVVDEAEKCMPVTTNVLQAAFPKPSIMKKRDSEETGVSLRQIRVGSTLSTMLYSHCPQNYRRVQAIRSVDMWRQGASQRIISTYNKLGLTLSANAGRGHIDELCKDHDASIVTLKKTVELQLSTDTILKGGRFGYSLCWDNIQILSHRTHQSKDRQNRMIMMALAFGAKHRTQSFHLTGLPLCTPLELPASTFLPSQSDLLEVRTRSELVVKRVLMEMWTDDNFTKRIRHQFSDEMDGPSEIVNLGLIHQNPSSTDGVRAIMNELNRYVPVVNGAPVTLCCNGDGMSIERMSNCQKDAARAPGALDRLEGQVPSPQEFHKEMKLLEDTMKTFFHIESTPDKGTLYHTKQLFNLNSVKKDVTKNHAHVWDLIEFTTKSYIVLMAQSVIEAEEPAFDPEMSKKEKSDYISNLSKIIVAMLWDFPTIKELRRIEAGYRGEKGDETYPHCCGQDLQTEMVQCGNVHCEVGWYHFSCLNITHDDTIGDWYCSPRCRRSGFSQYCVCKRRKGEEVETRRCGKTNDCIKGEYFHIECWNGKVIDETWYCSEVCASGDDEGTDKVLVHFRMLTLDGLKHLVRRDAVREGDGPAIISHWRMDMPQFWQRNHPKYRIIGHNFLARISGVANERLRHELTWERVANPPGRRAGNRGLDLVNEHLNNEFKDIATHTLNYTDKSLDRSVKVCGGFGKLVTQLIGEMHGNTIYFRSRKHNTKFMIPDIIRFVKNCKKSNLFVFRPGRKFNCEKLNDILPRALEDEEALAFGAKLKEYTEDLDFWAEVRQETADAEEEAQYQDD